MISYHCQWFPLAGHNKALEILIQEGGDYNQADKDNATPLHYAAELGNFLK